MDLCLVAGPVASLLTQVAKRVPWVAKYPKVVLALLTGAYAYALGTGWECWLQAFATGIASYEVIIKPATREEGKQ